MLWFILGGTALIVGGGVLLAIGDIPYTWWSAPGVYLNMIGGFLLGLGLGKSI